MSRCAANSLSRRAAHGATGISGVVLSFALGLVLVAFAPAAAGANQNCWTIADADQRALCRAIATRSAGQCTAIQDFALRQQCRARLGAGVGACNTVTSAWEREKCRENAVRR